MSAIPEQGDAVQDTWLTNLVIAKTQIKP